MERFLQGQAFADQWQWPAEEMNESTVSMASSITSRAQENEAYAPSIITESGDQSHIQISGRSPMTRREWSISPYPDARDFAFTIVHDADDAYSQRLAPLFQVFDDYKFKLTVTAFAFWAQWADKGAIWNVWNNHDPVLLPRAVPLEDHRELAFYQTLVQHGHEVGLHTASDTDDTKELTIDAFEYYKAQFGFYPPVYVEHRDNRENHQYQGAEPTSPYFVTDVLNRFGPWVWVVSPSAIPYNGKGRYFDLLSTQRPITGWFLARQWGTIKALLKTGAWNCANGQLFETMLRGGTPFDNYAKHKYGLAKAFRRSGRRQDADGNGFLKWYSDHNLDLLERHNGVAIVYTHLNTNWLDKKSFQMRPALRERMAAIASRNVWLATASTILDRFTRLSGLWLVKDGKWIKIVNSTTFALPGVTLVAPHDAGLCTNGRVLRSNGRKKIVVGDIGPLETLVYEIVD